MSSGRNNSFDMTNFRENLKRTHPAGILLENVRDTNSKVYEAASDLVDSRRRLAETKQKLKDLMKEIGHHQSEIIRKKYILESRTNELERGVTELQSTDTGTLNNQSVRILKMESWLMEDDIAEARKHINYAEEDLNEDTNDENRRASASKANHDMEADDVASNSSKENKCSICMERDLNSVIYKCGHRCMCYPCGLELMRSEMYPRCPICRMYIKELVQTFTC